MKTSHIFTRELIDTWCVMEVEIATQDLITPLTRENIPTICIFFDVLTQKPHGCGSSHGCGIIGFERLNDMTNITKSFFNRECYLCVICRQVCSNFAGRFQVWTTLETYRECPYSPQFTRSNRGDKTTIKATREEKTYFPIGVIKSNVDGFFEGVSNLFVVLRPTKLMNIPVSRVVAHKVIDIRVIEVTRWEDMNRCFQKGKCLSFTRKGDGVFGVTSIEHWSHANWISRGKKAFTIGVDHRKVTVDGFDSILNSEGMNEIHNNFAITFTCFFATAERTMIVDFTITHKHTVWSHKWLHTSLCEVIDGEAIKVHATLAQCFGTIVIRTSVCQETRWYFSSLTEEGHDATHV